MHFFLCEYGAILQKYSQRKNRSILRIDLKQSRHFELISFQRNEFWSLFQELSLLKALFYCYHHFDLYNKAF